MLSREQYIGVAALFVVAASTWFFVVSRPPESIPSQQEAEAVWQAHDSLRKDSIARVKARRDSLRQARWEHYKDSCKRADDARFAAWSAERKACYDSFRIADSLWHDSVGWRFARHVKKDTILDLNHCDTTELQYIHGIGRYTAIRIIEYRERLGGYYSPLQLTDPPFAKLRLDTLLGHFTASPDDVQKIDVNSCSTEDLSHHPYLRYEQAKAIYLLRRKYVRLDGIDDLRRVPQLDSTDIEKIQYYLRFE